MAKSKTKQSKSKSKPEPKGGRAAAGASAKKDTSSKKSDRAEQTVGKREIMAAVVAIVIGGPLVFVFASAVLDASARAKNDPIIAMIGTEAFDELNEGGATALHYYGNDRTAPDFTLRDQHGRAWSLEDHRGKVVIMNFWSVTCAPCIREMPSVVELSRLVKGRDDVEVVAISTDAGWSEVGRVFPARMDLKVLFDPDRSVVNGQFGTRVYPETWFIGPDGTVRLRVDGAREWDSALVLQLIERFSS